MIPMENRLRILMVSTSYPESDQDWRGRFIASLAAALGRRNDLSVALWAPHGTLPSGIVRNTTIADENWLRRLSDLGGIAHLLRRNKIRAVGKVLGLLERLFRSYRRHSVDVAHVNWLQNALPLWGTKTPAVISILGADFGLLRLPGMKALLRSMLRQRRVVLAPNAHWMAAELESAFGDIAEIETVPFGVDDPWFALQRLPVKENVHHWLVITRVTSKKIGDLFEWGEGLFGPNRVLHLFGPMQEMMTLPSWVQYHGPTHPAELLDTWFPLASGLITLSRHDEGRPQVMLEAMAAGLPVIATDLPAHRDIVHHRETGWLATSRKDFSNALDYVEISEHNQTLGEAARKWVTQHIGSWDDCAGRYALIYTKLLKASP